MLHSKRMQLKDFSLSENSRTRKFISLSEKVLFLPWALPIILALSVIGAGWASTAAPDTYLEPNFVASTTENPTDNQVKKIHRIFPEISRSF
jgi:hypothetical protein